MCNWFRCGLPLHIFLALTSFSFCNSSLDQTHQLQHHHHSSHNHGHSFSNPKLLYDLALRSTYSSHNYQVDLLTIDQLIKTLDPFEDRDLENITLAIFQISQNQSLEQVGDEIDQFITTRPWWVVDLEPYKWFAWKTEVVLHRVPYQHKTYFRRLIFQNFPSENVCSQSPVFISNHHSDEWGNRMLNMMGEWKRYRSCVFHVFASSNANVDGRTSFAGPEVCPTVMNKWTCLFLPTSNCTLPKPLRDCRSEKCLSPTWGLYSNSSDTATLVPRHDNNFVESVIGRGDLANDKCLPFEAMHSSTPLTFISDNTTVRRKACTQSEFGVAFLFGFLIRFNADFRSRIAQRVFEFREPQNSMGSQHTSTNAMPIAAQSQPWSFPPGASCVAVHARLGDRRIEGLDMIAWCELCTIRDGDDTKQFNKSCVLDRKIHESTWMDVGCFSRLPFGASTLRHYINASRVLLPNNRNIFIMTDDGLWLHSQIHLLTNHSMHPHSHAHTTPDASVHTSSSASASRGQALHVRIDDWNIFAFVAAPSHRDKSAAASVEFWASIQLAQQCEAFAGHFSSSSTLIVHRAMCFRHAHSNFLKCPPAFDIGAQNL